MAKKIAVEGSLFFKRPTGVGQYALSLIKAASTLDSNIEFDVVRQWLWFKKFQAPIPQTKHLHYRLIKWFPPMIYYQLFKRLPKFIPYDWTALRKYDAMLFFNFISYPLSKGTKSIIVIHDMTFTKYPQYMQATNLKYMSKLMPASIRRANHIITVSESSKNDIINYSRVEPGRISVIPNAVDHNVFYPRRNIKGTLKKYGLTTKYIHFHGTIEPRKNIEGLLDAYISLPEKIKKEYSLVLTGGKGWNDEAIYRKIDAYRALGHRIVLPGYVDSKDLPAIYSGASLFVLPSFYEGFGIPPLEAMACGVPVITSDNSSLPEVVGNAGIMIKAEDTEALSANMTRILSDKKLAKSLSQKGLKRSTKFNWEDSAKKLVKLLEDI